MILNLIITLTGGCFWGMEKFYRKQVYNIEFLLYISHILSLEMV